jgi:hypothetical protein
MNIPQTAHDVEWTLMPEKTKPTRQRPVNGGFARPRAISFLPQNPRAEDEVPVPTKRVMYANSSLRADQVTSVLDASAASPAPALVGWRDRYVGPLPAEQARSETARTSEIFHLARARTFADTKNVF